MGIDATLTDETVRRLSGGSEVSGNLSSGRSAEVTGNSSSPGSRFLRNSFTAVCVARILSLAWHRRVCVPAMTCRRHGIRYRDELPQMRQMRQYRVAHWRILG